MAAPSTPDLMSYQEWMKGTSVGFQMRSKLLKALDNEIHSYERGPSAVKAARVRGAFDAWKRSKGAGSEWKESSRNKNKMATLLDSMLTGQGDTDVGLGAQSFMQPALINSRLGVLYLFGNTLVDDSYFKIALDGAVSITTAALTYTSKDQAVDQTIRDNTKTASSVVGAAKKPLGMAASEIESRITKPKKKVVESQDLLLEDDAPPQESWLRTQFDKLVAKLREMSGKIMETIRSKIADFKGDPANVLLSTLPGLLRKLINILVKRLLKAAAPLIGAGLDLAKGVANTIDSGVTKFKEWSASRGVEILFGHPGTIVEAIRRSMWFSVGAGLYDTLKGATKLGLEIASAGGTVLMNMIVSIVETLAKTIWRIVEVYRLRSFCTQAKDHWKAREERSGLHTRPVAFNNWYKTYAMGIPAIAALTLNSGICGDKMHFLSMFKDDDTIISQAQFDAGCKYVDSLKVWGTDHLKSTGFKFKSNDDVVSGLLKFAQSHTAPTGNAEKAWKATLGFLNG